MRSDTSQTTKKRMMPAETSPEKTKRMPLMMEESGYTVGVIDVPKDQEKTDWTLIAELLRALADKIEECDA